LTHRLSRYTTSARTHKPAHGPSITQAPSGVALNIDGRLAASFQAATGEDQAERELLDQLRDGQDRLTGLAHACEDSWVLGVVRL
jgi:hypothetical protein